jgi:hypothetical protein
MELSLAPNMTIAYLNEAFRFFYPNLKLVFFQKTFSDSQKLAENVRIIDESFYLKDLSLKKVRGIIQIDDDESTGNFEADLEENFGLHVEVFRRSGDLWLLTTLSDAHSLAEQEINAENSLVNQYVEPEFIDYREQK